MALLILSFIAGVLTIAAPCVLPLLPVIVGGSLVENDEEKSTHQWLRPLVIALSLALSVVSFTLLIKATTVLLGVPQIVWQVVSGLIVIALGINYVWPKAWEVLSSRSGLFTTSNAALGKAYKHKGLWGAILIGVALGPVFSSCSPTYALIVATILPVSFAQGLIYLIAYALGMSITLLLIAYLGQVFLSKLRWLSNPNGWFKKLVGILFITVGIFVLFGVDKKIQAYVLEQGWYDPISNIEKRLSN
ncbi:MAG: Sulfite exporter TauE/SafE family protein [Patescibacteria group bacterium]|nr:Sulfite exporter TauE/SafE family protein [Patescibacteria group bacterium]